MSAKDDASSLRARAARFWSRHRTLFWTLHSVWALATGVVVVLFARERYGFVPWVVLFLVLTWASTLFFGRRMAGEATGGGEPGFMEETTSYLTRTMYQETMFFLLPFYAYSTVTGSLNMVFTGLLAVLAVTSCFDLLFDRWLRSSRVASLLFFSVVAFAAANLLVPILLPVDPTVGLRWAAGIAVASAIPLALQRRRWDWKSIFLVGLAGTVFLAATVGAPQLVPAVPLRLESLVFSSGLDPESLTVADTLPSGASAARVGDGLYVLGRVFAPTVVPTEVSVEWQRNGETLRVSRAIEITAHELGFRVWERLRPDTGAGLPPGRYRVVLRTRSGRVFGEGAITLSP